MVLNSATNDNQNTEIFSPIASGAKKYQVGLNHKITGKTNPQNLSYAGAWKPGEVTLWDLAGHISKGHPWMPSLLDGNGKRILENANYAEILALDIDNTEFRNGPDGKRVMGEDGKAVKFYKEELTLDNAHTHPFIGQHAAIVIPSASHKEDWHKFRVIFVLPRPAIGNEIRICNLYLRHLSGGISDRSCHDKTRYFFGSQGAEATWIRQVTLWDSFIEDAIAWDTENTPVYAVEAHTYSPAEVQDRLPEIESAVNAIWPYSPGGGTRPDYVRVCCGLINALGEAEGARLILQSGMMANHERGAEKFVKSIAKTVSRGGRAGLKSVFDMAINCGWQRPKRTEEEIRAWVLTQYPDPQARRDYVQRTKSPEERKAYREKRAREKQAELEAKIKICGLESDQTKKIALCLADPVNLAELPAKIDMPIIGVGSSDPQVGDILKRIQTAGLERKGTIALVPNPGEAHDQARMDWYREFARKAAMKGYKINVLWWNQWEKTDPGIDRVEKASFSSMKFDRWAALIQSPYRLRLEEEKLGRYDIRLDTMNMQNDCPKLEASFVVTDSAPSTGKTKNISRETEGESILSVSHRRTLAEAFAAATGSTYRNKAGRDSGDQVYLDDEMEVARRIAMVANSLMLTDLDNQFPDGIDTIVLDEFEALFRYVYTGGTCKTNRLDIIDRAKYAVARADRLIAADGDASRLGLEILQKWRGKETPFIVGNDALPTKREIEFLVPNKGGSNAAVEYCLGNLGEFNLWTTDSRKKSEHIVAQLEKMGRKAFVINSVRQGDGASSDEYQEALTLVNTGDIKALRAMGYTDLIVSPSVVQGLSFEQEGIIDRNFAIFTGGSITPREMRQQILRDRRAKKIYIYCSDARIHASEWGTETEWEPIYDRLIGNDKWIAGQAGKGSEAISPAQREAAEIAARLIANDNFWMINPRAGLVALLQDWQFDINFTGISQTGQVMKQTAEEWQTAQYQSVVDAKVITQADQMALISKRTEGNDAITKDERLSIERHQICREYAIAPETLDLPVMELDNNGKFRKRLHRLEALLAPDGEAIAKEKAMRTLGLAAIDKDRSFLQLQFGRAMGVRELMMGLILTGEFSKDHPIIQNFARIAIKNAAKFKAYLNYTPSAKIEPLRIVKDVLRLYGFEFKSRRTRKEGRPVWLHRIDELHMDALLGIIDRRYLARMNTADQIKAQDYRLVRGDQLIRRFFNIDFQYPADHFLSQPQIATDTVFPQTVYKFSKIAYDPAWIERTDLVESETSPTIDFAQLALT